MNPLDNSLERWFGAALSLVVSLDALSIGRYTVAPGNPTRVMRARVVHGVGYGSQSPGPLPLLGWETGSLKVPFAYSKVPVFVTEMRPDTRWVIESDFPTGSHITGRGVGRRGEDGGPLSVTMGGNRLKKGQRNAHTTDLLF